MQFSYSVIKMGQQQQQNISRKQTKQVEHNLLRQVNKSEQYASAQEINLAWKDMPAQFHHLLVDIQEINHARSISGATLEDYEAVVHQDEQQQINTEFQQYQQIVFTPSKIALNHSRRSTIFTSTHTPDQKYSNFSPSDKKIQVYFFGQPTKKQIKILPSTTIDSLIEKSLHAYSQDYSLDQTFLTSKDPKNYEMRFIKDEGTCLPDYSVEAIKRDRVIVDSLFQVLVLVRTNKIVWGGKTQGKQTQLKQQEANNEEGTVKLNIFNEVNLHVSTIIISKSETVKKAIEFLQVELEEKILLFEDLQNQIPLPQDMDIKNLCSFKLFVKKRRFLDEPEPESIVPLRVISTLPKDLTENPVLPPIGITEASRYQQFQVIKINPRGAEQPRIIGFDQTKYYNYDVSVRKKHQQPSFFSVFIGNNILTGTKKPEKSINSILGVNQLSGVGFQLIFAEKKVGFKAKSAKQRDRIVRKVRFLITYNRGSK